MLSSISLKRFHYALLGSALLVGLATGCRPKSEAPAASTPAPPAPVTPNTANAAPANANQSTSALEDPSKSVYSVGDIPLTKRPPSKTETVESLQVKLAKNPKDVQIRIQIVQLLDLRGDHGAAEDLLNAALQQGLRDPELYHALGMLYLRLSASQQADRQTLLKGAVEEFKLELKANPKSFEGHLNLGRAYMELEQALPSLNEFEAALKLNPNDPDVYLGMAFLNNSSARYPYAVKYLEEYIKRAQNKGPGYALLSRILLNMREYAKAVEAGKQAVQIMPNSASSWYILGQSYFYQPANQDWKAAADAYQHVIKFVPNWANAYFELGKALERLGRKDEAIANYKTAIQYAPFKGKYQFQLGKALTDMGKSDEGKQVTFASQKYIKLNGEEDIWTTKIATNPKEPENYYQLGLVYMQYPDYAKAKQCLEAVLSVNPKYKDARAQWSKIPAVQGTPMMNAPSMSGDAPASSPLTGTAK